MDRKSFLLLSSAMLVIWACGEGEILGVENEDELAVNKIVEMEDSLFLKSYIEEACKGSKNKKECATSLYKSSSSKAKSSSSVGKSSSSSSGKSSSSKDGDGKSSSSSGKSSSSGNSSSSSGKSSSSTASSSSQDVPQISGKCVLIKPATVHVGDEIIWNYLPDDNSIESAKYEWQVSNAVEKSIVSGKLEGEGLPEITVVFSTAGKKYGPVLSFGGQDFDCEDLIVYDVGDDPNSSSSGKTESSSSSAPESSSSSKARSSSSSVVEGHCAVNKSQVYVGEEVELYVAGPDGEELSGKYNWFEMDDDAEVVAGERTGKNGSTRITVTYSEAGVKNSQVQYGNQLIICDNDSEGDPLLTVMAKEVSSSSVEVEESSSSEEEEPESSSSKSSSSKGNDPPPVIDL